MKIKVCGLKENILEVASLKPDFMGFIFYKKSPRYLHEDKREILKKISKDIKKVGVFVNEKTENILEIAKKYELDFIQFHGNESQKDIETIKSKGLKTIKAFQINDKLPENLSRFKKCVDYFLFDTQTKYYGGSGEKFKWDILNLLHEDILFFLSGGIALDDFENIKKQNFSKLFAIDINSKFEIRAGEKDMDMLKKLFIKARK